MSFNPVSEKDVNELKLIADSSRVFTAEEILQDYYHDEMEGVHCSPEVLIKVSSSEEVAAILAYCNKQGLPVVPRGSGTGLVGGAVAIEGGVMLDMTLMNRILELDRKNMTVTVEPGVLLMDLAAYAESNDFFYPPDPGEKSATIGGNISTNAGGMRAVKYGVTRDYVLSLTVALADGTLATFGAGTVKNSSGYSLKDLIIGSEGTLAVIVAAKLRLLPKPAISVSLLAAYNSFSTAIATVPDVLLSGTDPTAIEFLTKNAIALTEDYLGRRFPKFKGSSALLLTYDGSIEQDIKARMEHAAQICLSSGALDCYYVDTEERSKSVWSIRGAFFEAVKASTDQLDECDVVVPRDSITEFVAAVESIADQSGLRMEYFGHAGDGNLHIYFCRDGIDKEQWYCRVNSCFDALYREAATLGGLVSGEHGIGYAKRLHLSRQLGEHQLELMRRIKAAFDPNGILNPGKVCMIDNVLR